jgi:peptide/nickel transport system permease protein
VSIDQERQRTGPTSDVHQDRETGEVDPLVEQLPETELVLQVPLSVARARLGAIAATVRRSPPGLLLAWAVVVLVVLWALFPSLFTAQNPIVGNPLHQLESPSLSHWFGTDELGRDEWTRIVYGASQSLLGGLVSVALGLSLGMILGVAAGSLGRVVDDVVMRIVDVLLAIPSLLMAMSILAILGFGTINASIAVGITSIAFFARLARAQVVRVRRTDYVEAAFGSGGRTTRVLWRHILPNSVGPVISLAALQFGSAILQISTLGFLGYGAPPPNPEWGLLIADGRTYIATAWWLTTMPGLVIVAVVLSSNRISRSIDRRS